MRCFNCFFSAAAALFMAAAPISAEAGAGAQAAVRGSDRRCRLRESGELPVSGSQWTGQLHQARQLRNPEDEEVPLPDRPDREHEI